MQPQITVVIDLPVDFIEQVAKKIIELQPSVNNTTSKSFFTVKEVSKILEKNPKTIQNHINAGLLVASKPGKHFIITEDNLNNYINHNGK